MECELHYLILTEDVKREIEKDVSEDEFSIGDDSESETLNDDSDLEFDFAEADISERSKGELLSQKLVVVH